ncbi:MAG: acylphosphatase [Sneathiella sp.]|nr:acylphosphatase [Sneathiella sp.]
MITVHAMITGRVQGVGYRAWTVDEARRHGVRGWVRNRSDRSVEAMLQGDVTKVEALIEKCWQGPLMARVVDIRRREKPDVDVFNDFTSKSTL